MYDRVAIHSDESRELQNLGNSKNHLEKPGILRKSKSFACCCKVHIIEDDISSESMASKEYKEKDLKHIYIVK